MLEVSPPKKQAVGIRECVEGALVKVAPRNQLFGYTCTVGWNYPLYLTRFSGHSRSGQLAVLLGSEAYDVARVESLCVVDNVFITRTRFVMYPRNMSAKQDNNEVICPKVRQFYATLLDSRNNRIRQCLTRT